MSKRLLILGDSHVSFFEYIYHGGYHHGHGYGFKSPQRTSPFHTKKPYDSLDIQVCKVQGATAYGILNTESKTGSNDYFSRFLNNEEVINKESSHLKYYADIEANPPDYVCFFLGEIDCRGLTTSLKSKYPNWKDILDISVENLNKFIEEKVIKKIVDSGRIVFLSPHLSKSVDNINESLELSDLTERTYYFSDLLKKVPNSITIDINDHLLDSNTNHVHERFMGNMEADQIHLWPINVYNNEISTLWAEELCKLPESDPSELHKLGFHGCKSLDGGNDRWAKSNEQGKHSSSWRDWPCQKKN